MYLKRLTIQGFKSFANRTVLEFEPGVTAIVGPNGSGKSNVADAIRWVLGEQSARLLRARRQEDVIFAGGGKRPAVGMAEVFLTLDNQDGWLPLDFSEVELGRRLYRDGESEYLLNGARVRLRDLTDLLLKADVGQNSYTIMGQGLVDEVLLMSSEGRRNLIDEAADVRRFRLRVAEARDKLAATQTNLERVELILAELEPRLNQLRRQAERASRHLHLARELSQLLQAYYSELWASAQNQLTAARAALDQKIAEQDEGQRRVESLESQLRALNEEITKRRALLSSRRAKESELDVALSAAERSLALDRDRLAILTERAGDLEREIDDLEREITALGEAPDDAPAEDATAEDPLAAARERAERARSELEEAQAAAAAAARLNECDDAIAAITADRERLDSQVMATATRIHALEREEAEAREARRALLAELKARSAAFREARESLQRLEDRCEAARTAAEAARQRLLSASEQARVPEAGGTSGSSELQRLEARLEALKWVQTEMLGLAAGTRAALRLGGALPSATPEDAQAPPEVEGVIGLLAQHLRVPPKLERAINAALESRLHAIVIESQEEAIRLLTLLQEQRAGRATVLPLDAIRHVYPLNLSKEKGVVGVAAKLVRCGDNLRPLVDTLLGRVIIVENIAAGLRTVQRGLGVVVTLDGTLIEPQGFLTGGATGADEGMLLRLRELEELPARIEELRRRTPAAARPAAVAGPLAEAANAAQEAGREHERLLQEAAAARARLQAERAGLDRVRRKLTAWKSEAAARARELANHRSSLAEKEQESRSLAERLISLTAERSELADLAAKVRARADLALTALTAASADLAEAEARQAAAASVREQRERERERLASQLRSRRSRLEETNQSRDETEARIARQARELEALQQQRAAESQDLEPVRDELLRLEAHERQVAGEVQAAQRDLLTLERSRLDLESQVARLLEHLDSLRAEMSREGLAPDASGRVVSAETPPAGSPERSLRGGAPLDIEAAKARVDEIRREIRRIGPVNQEAPEDLQELEERYSFLSGQLDDLTTARAQLLDVITELNDEIKGRFGSAFDRINAAFAEHFTAFFGGGSARLILTDPNDLAETGVDVEARPPGKKVRNLNLLSGGERSLTAVALLFALLTVNPAPFCVLDEVDAALDEANVGRFTRALEQLAANTQFVLVTHNRRTIEHADTIYGISMTADGVSKVLSVRLQDIDEDGAMKDRRQS